MSIKLLPDSKGMARSRPGLGRIGQSFVLLWRCPQFFPELEFFSVHVMTGITGLTTTRATALAGTVGFELEAKTTSKN